jgi:pilus assembly protein Flp/PilA
MLYNLVKYMENFKQDRQAVTAIEYALIAALIAVTIIGAVSSMGTGIAGTFGNVSSEL